MGAYRQPALINPNREWVIAELGRLRDEWIAWQETAAKIGDHSYDPRTHSDAFADGEANMRYHDILQTKTLAFLSANIKNHGFIEGFDGNGCDRTDLRIPYRVRHRLHELDALRSSLEYAIVLDHTSMPEPATTTQGSIKRSLGLFAKQHWSDIAKWIFGVAATILTAYLLRLLG